MFGGNGFERRQPQLRLVVGVPGRPRQRGGGVRAGDTASAADTAALHQKALRRSLWRDVRYVLSIRTNVVLVVGSSFGYFFFTGLSTFGVALLSGRFQIGQAAATLLIYVLGVGALIGVLSTGRIADWLTARGHISARMMVGGAAFLVAAIFILPTLLAHSLWLAMVFAFFAGIGGHRAFPAVGDCGSGADHAGVDIHGVGAVGVRHCVDPTRRVNGRRQRGGGCPERSPRVATPLPHHAGFAGHRRSAHLVRGTPHLSTRRRDSDGL